MYAIGDLHLSASGEKPMGVFGPEWENHDEKIAANWARTVGPDDLVLIPGDLSWAMRLEEAGPDLRFVESLPGTKYFIRGNHDYWFKGPKAVRERLGPSTHVIRFDAAVHAGVGVCGVRGWMGPWHPDYEPAEDDRHWRRARLRLEMSLKALERLDWRVAVCMFHYPPCPPGEPTELTHMVSDAGVRHAVYGHLHGENAENAFEGEVDGTLYRCVSADRVGFAPALILETD
ncbi:MAG: metallophosphoesterase [Planctomycetota bacterium]